jgi:anti-anti-sigma factor
MAAPSHIATLRDPRVGLRIVTRQHGATTTIALQGEWDLAQRRSTREAVHLALRPRPECLVFDLGELEFIDSSGLNVLVDAHRRCVGTDTRLVIIPGPRAVQRVFELCGLNEILTFADEYPHARD